MASSRFASQDLVVAKKFRTLLAADAFAAGISCGWHDRPKEDRIPDRRQSACYIECMRLMAWALVVALQVEDPEEIYRRGVESYNSGRLEEALRLLQAAAARRPNVPDFRFSLGLAYLRAGRPKEAARELEAVLGMTGLERSTRVKEAEVLFRCGTAYLQLGNLKSARRRLEMALAREAGLGEAHYALGLIEQKEGRPDKALERFEAALASNPDDAQANLAAASLLGELGKRAEALSRLRRAARGDSGSYEIQMALGLAEFEEGSLGEAARAFERALGLRPDDREAAFNLGTAVLALKDYQRAIEILAPLSSGEKPHDGASFNLAQAYRAAGRPAEARVVLEALAARSPAHPNLHFSLGLLLEQSQDWAAAERAYRKEIEVRPEFIPSYLNLAALLEKRGRKQEALEQLRLALALNPGGEEGEKIKAAVSALEKFR